MLNFKACSATIIGGADGPTAIFVSSTWNTGNIVLVCLAAGLAVGFIAGLLYKRYRRTKNKKDGSKL